MNASDAKPQPWAPQEGPQLDAISAHWCEELFFGGARGGGKSDFLLGDYAVDVRSYGEAWQGILFRASYPELEELIRRGRQIFPAMYPGARYHEGRREFLFPGGAVLKMRYLERDADADAYQGHQYAWIGWDELAKRATPYAYNALKACLRSAAPIPNKRIRSTGNPGGSGHQWVKAYFAIDRHPFGGLPLDDPASGMTRMFVRSRVQDNRILLANDPGYVARLRGVGSDSLVLAWLEGDWDAIAGAFFDGWSAERHVVRPFAVPEGWTRFRALDWGFAKPFSVGWWAVASDPWRIAPAEAGGREIVVPRGALLRYREWYGVKTKPDGTREPNVGLRLTAEQVAEGILARERPEERELIRYGVADPSTFAQDGGPSIAERLFRAGVAFRPADNARVSRGGAMGGWDQMRARLAGDGERPAIFCFSSCEDSIRTIPSLQHDRDKAEDLDTDGEDHAADEWRYACMSRPWAAPTPTPTEDKGPLGVTFGEMLAAHKAKKRREREGD